MKSLRGGGRGEDKKIKIKSATSSLPMEKTDKLLGFSQGLMATADHELKPMEDKFETVLISSREIRRLNIGLINYLLSSAAVLLDTICCALPF